MELKNLRTLLTVADQGSYQKAADTLDGLYVDWKNGEISHEQYLRMKLRLEEQYQRLQETIVRVQSECDAASQPSGAVHPDLAAFLTRRNITGLSRGLLTTLVKVIFVHEDKSIDIEFSFADPCRPVAHKPTRPPGLPAP